MPGNYKVDLGLGLELQIENDHPLPNYRLCIEDVEWKLTRRLVDNIVLVRKVFSEAG